MRASAVVLAFAAALLRPSSPDWQLSLPSAHPGILAAVESWFSPALRPSAEPVRRDEAVSSTCTCKRPAAEHLEPSVLARAFVAGLAGWPAADLAWLCKLAWQRQVAAAERALQVRAPERP